MIPRGRLASKPGPGLRCVGDGPSTCATSPSMGGCSTSTLRDRRLSVDRSEIPRAERSTTHEPNRPSHPASRPAPHVPPCHQLHTLMQIHTIQLARLSVQIGPRPREPRRPPATHPAPPHPTRPTGGTPHARPNRLHIAPRELAHTPERASAACPPAPPPRHTRQDQLVRIGGTGAHEPSEPP